MAAPVDAPFLIALNLTRRCNLSCAHCYLDAGTRDDGDTGELNTEEVCRLLDQIAEVGPGAMVVMTGGEPTLRPDIVTLCNYAADLGLMVVLGTNGTTLTDDNVAKLARNGVRGAGISLDSLDPDFHDDFRGLKGSWAKTMAGIDACRRAGLPFQIHFSVTDDNAHELDEMIAFARSSGALVLNVFFLVCTGRGETVTNISRETYDRVLQRVTEAAHDEEKLMVRAKCAPHFKRMALELDPEWPITLAQGYEAGGCLAGSRYCRVTPEGDVTACPYIEESVGSIRDTAFATIWRDAPMFEALRQPALTGRCGDCEYRKMCGGCRARPFARDGDLMAEDFLCSYQPKGGAVIEPLRKDANALVWAPDAERRLSRVPAFLRRMVRNRAEAFAAEQGASQVTVDHLETLVRRRFGDAGPPRPPAGIKP